MAWKIKYTEIAAKQMKKLDKKISRNIDDYLNNRIAKKNDPRSFGKALTHHKLGIWRYRLGDYRILCEIKDHELTILALQIGHRKNVYG